jgi:hypothetical protein
LLPRPAVTWYLMHVTAFASNTISLMLPSSAMSTTSMRLTSLKARVPARV